MDYFGYQTNYLISYSEYLQIYSEYSNIIYIWKLHCELSQLLSKFKKEIQDINIFKVI